MRRYFHPHELKKTLEVFAHKLYISYSLYSKNELQNHAGAVAYFFLLSIIPVVLLFLYIFDSYLQAYPEFSEQFFTLLSSFHEQLNRDLLEKIGLVNLSGSTIGIIGILNLLWISRLIMRSVQRAFGIIFPTNRSRHVILKAVTSFIIVPLLFSLVALSILSKFLFGLLNTIGQNLPIPQDLVIQSSELFSNFLPYFIAYLIILKSYRYLPVERPSFRAAFEASTLCILSIFALKLIFTQIFSVAALNIFYGIIGSLILTIIWVYFVFVLYFWFAEYAYVTDRLDVLVLDRMFFHSFKEDQTANWLESRLFQHPHVVQKYARSFAKGDIIFNEGEKTQTIFYVYSGQVGVYKHVARGTRCLSTIGPGEIFGEMAYLLHEERTATLVAEKPTVLFTLQPALFEKLLEVNHVLSRQIIQILTDRLNHMNPTAADKEPIPDNLPVYTEVESR